MTGAPLYTCLLERDRIVEYAAISGSDGPAHIDETFAVEHFGGLVVHGALLAQVMLSAIQDEGLIRESVELEIDVRFRKVVLVGAEFGVWVDPEGGTDEGLEVRGTADGVESVVMRLQTRDVGRVQ